MLDIPNLVEKLQFAWDIAQAAPLGNVKDIIEC